MVITVTVVGPFEEEEEGTGTASDLVKVQGEDLATPGLLPKELTGIDPGTVTIPQYRVNKTKQHTHTHSVQVCAEHEAAPFYTRKTKNPIGSDLG